MIKYKQIKDRDGKIINNLIIKNNELVIPFDPANMDANQFAKWLQDGGIPEAATAGEVVTQEWINQTIAKLLPSG